MERSTIWTSPNRKWVAIQEELFPGLLLMDKQKAESFRVVWIGDLYSNFEEKERRFPMYVTEKLLELLPMEPPKEANPAPTYSDGYLVVNDYVKADADLTIMMFDAAKRFVNLGNIAEIKQERAFDQERKKWGTIVGAVYNKPHHPFMYCAYHIVYDDGSRGTEWAKNVSIPQHDKHLMYSPDCCPTCGKAW